MKRILILSAIIAFASCSKNSSPEVESVPFFFDLTGSQWRTDDVAANAENNTHGSNKYYEVISFESPTALKVDLVMGGTVVLNKSKGTYVLTGNTISVKREGFPVEEKFTLINDSTFNRDNKSSAYNTYQRIKSR